MTDRTPGDVRLREDERADLVAALRAHQAVATGLGEWACKCSPMEWRPGAYRSAHMADAAAEVVERVVAARVGEVVEERDHWRRRWQAQREQFREMLFGGMSLADWHAKHCAAMQARREVVERVEAVRAADNASFTGVNEAEEGSC